MNRFRAKLHLNDIAADGDGTAAGCDNAAPRDGTATDCGNAAEAADKMTDAADPLD